MTLVLPGNFPVIVFESVSRSLLRYPPIVALCIKFRFTATT